MKKRQPGEVKPGKRISESTVEMAEIVLPNDTNPLGTMLGGKVMHLIDIAGAIAAHRHSRRYVVTASVDNLEFQYPLRTGRVILLKAHVTRAFQTSMEVEVRVFLEDTLTGKKKRPVRPSSPMWRWTIEATPRRFRLSCPVRQRKSAVMRRHACVAAAD